MNPDEIRKQFEEIHSLLDDVRQAIRTANTRLDQVSVAEPLPHFHKRDRIDMKDLKGGFEIVASTPSQVAEEGKFAIYDTPTATTRRLYVKVNGTWRYATLT